MSSIRNLWIRWKMLRLPWRKSYIVGQDLAGNTYWEFKNAMKSGQMRRIVKGSRKLHHSDVQISPQWHQWLRHTRSEAPTIQEQQMDVTRQIQLKQNARLADERWASKKKYIEKPATQQEEPRVERMTMDDNPEVREGQQAIQGGNAPKTEPAHKEGVRNAVADPLQQAKESGKKSKPDPWEEEKQRQKQTAANPSGTWQPEAWSPGTRRK